ncbi:hypothetical protein DICPUDRAFT_154337 [Dictyostelium purpureum]|uniref:Uncharacterized protein n=1 Tax=Dictyostelium purpureum TaxID=5786 RepID=F0ZR30_DICPU|nr:uncharacterized protein DICPUDRAFT_154337 [Dictyostelium purpureum]EGC33601.1 hypothetical protein DICPUDRAFT_154337 [Dictyostelium purpureum]|eukprot:XP_003289869.1 hypothetical protein DICPUDRAFT_154337 [Dictyostelium purpureum]
MNSIIKLLFIFALAFALVSNVNAIDTEPTLKNSQVDKWCRTLSALKCSFSNLCFYDPYEHKCKEMRLK